MAEEKAKIETHLILQAYNENWGLIGPGDWHSVTWRIFSDGSYSINSSFGSDDEFGKPVRRWGKMRAPSFHKLTEAISCEWNEGLFDVDGCDGNAWAIEQYDEKGKILRSSGPLGYIYGKEKIERIIKLLPRRDCAYEKKSVLDPYRPEKEGYRAEQRIRKTGNSTRCTLRQSFTLIPFAMDREREQFLIFMLPREKSLSVFLWVYFDEGEEPRKRIRITAVNDLMQYTKWTGEAMDVSGKYPDEIVNKSFSILTSHPCGELWSLFEEMTKTMDHIGGAQRWKPIEKEILDLTEEVKHEHDGIMYMY